MALAGERLDLDAVVGLLLEVLLDVVDDDHLRQISAQRTEVFHPGVASLLDVVSVQPVLDDLVLVDSVEDPVCVLGDSGLLLGRRP